MRHVDTLSRVSCLTLEEIVLYRLQQVQVGDYFVKAVCTALEKNSFEDFYLKPDIFRKNPIKELIFVPSLDDESIKMVQGGDLRLEKAKVEKRND